MEDELESIEWDEWVDDLVYCDRRGVWNFVMNAHTEKILPSASIDERLFRPLVKRGIHHTVLCKSCRLPSSLSSFLTKLCPVLP